MIARLVISPDITSRVEEIKKILASHIESGNTNHPDLLYFQAGRKLGIAEAKQIKAHLSLKPYSAKGRVVVVEDAAVATIEAQNALLKTLEELAKDTILILGASSDNNLLPTILSRCEIVSLTTTNNDRLVYHTKYAEDLDKLLNSSVENRFAYVEKLKSREEFLHALIYYFRDILVQEITNGDAAVQRNVTKRGTNEFLKELLQAEQWTKQNVSLRAILEYLMLKMPTSNLKTQMSKLKTKT